MKRLPWVGGPIPAKKTPSVGSVYFCVPHENTSAWLQRQSIQGGSARPRSQRSAQFMPPLLFKLYSFFPFTIVSLPPLHGKFQNFYFSLAVLQYAHNRLLFYLIKKKYLTRHKSNLKLYCSNTLGSFQVTFKPCCDFTNGEPFVIHSGNGAFSILVLSMQT